MSYKIKVICTDCEKATIRPCDKTCNDPCPHCESTNTIKEVIEIIE